jgi:phage head maturation protease
MQMGASVPALNSKTSEKERDCQERSQLAKQYDATIEAYTESVKAMMDVHEMEPRNAFQRVLEARNACETLRTALVDHEQQHRCANGHAASM